jgi:hypothetical protein
MTNQTLFPDTLTQRIGVLTRRETEARILAPIIEALGEVFGRDEVIGVVRDTIIKIAQEQGVELAEAMGGCGSGEFLDSLQYWTKDEALHIGVINSTPEKLDFNVTRCRYAEMYRALGIPELGAVLSCNRDYALIEGFNPRAELTRTQTIMEGATHCDFRYLFPKQDEEQPPSLNTNVI